MNTRSLLISIFLAGASVGPYSVTLAMDCATPGCEKGTKYNRDSIPIIRYTIVNDSGRTVRFRLPSGKRYELSSGQRGSYENTVRYNDRLIFVYNTRRTYRLKSGDHKFWWNRMENRVGFDQNYRHK